MIAVVVIGGKPVPLFANLDDGPQWLDKNFGKSAGVAVLAETDWTVFRGNRARNGAARLPKKPRNIAWKKSIIPDPISDRSDQTETAVRTQLKDVVTSLKNQYQQQRWNVFPNTHPIAVGGILITRTMSSLRAIDVGETSAVNRSCILRTSLPSERG